MLTERDYASDERNTSPAGIACSTNNLRDHNGSITEFVNLHACPCSVQEVYTLAISLQYYIGNLYLEIADISHEPQKTLYTNLAMRQLETKNDLQRICNDYLNELMYRFYKAGGPIIDDRLSELQLKDIQAFYKRILTNLLLHFDLLVDMSFNGSLSIEQMLTEISDYTFHTYTTLGKLYSDNKIQRAFNELINSIPVA